MLALAHHYNELLVSPAGSYRARVYGQAEDDGRWSGWIVFFPLLGGRVIATDRETTQSSLADLGYWAAGLTQVYLYGALERALALQPAAQLARELETLERMEASSNIRADMLEAEASLARTESQLAEAARERTEERFLETVAATAETEAAAHERAAATARGTAHAADRALRSRTQAKSARAKSSKKKK